MARATLNHNPAGVNNGITFRSKVLPGNNIRVAFVVAGLNTVRSISVAGNDVTVNLATDGAGAVAATETATNIAAAINAHAGASALLEATADEGTGAGVTAALAMTSLAGGTLRLSAHEDAVAAGFSRTQLDRGAAGGSPRYETTYEKHLVGAAGFTGVRFRATGHSDVSQNAADTSALSALDYQRGHRYGLDETARSLGPAGTALTVDVS